MSTNFRNFNFTEGNNSSITGNPAFQFAQRHALNIYRSNAIYTFIPKNGCTTLRASLAVDNGFLEESQLSSQINWVHNNTYSYSSNIRELVTANYTFTILRCPYDRFASLFLDKFVDKTPIAWNFYRQSNNKFELDELTFTDLITHFKENPNILNGDIHWRKQCDFLIYQNYDDYFDFSDFDTIKNTLSKKINLKLIDARKLTNHGRENHTMPTDEIDYSLMSVKEIHELKTKGILPSTNQLLTSQNKSVLEQIYRSDLNLINLKFK